MKLMVLHLHRALSGCLSRGNAGTPDEATKVNHRLP